MECRLVVLSGWANEIFPLEEGESLIGRDTRCAIQLTSSDVSRRHARIINMPGVVEIEDLKSANGTHVNGNRIERVRLMHGNQIRIGQTLFVFEESSAAGFNESAGQHDYSDRSRATTVRAKPVSEATQQGKPRVRPLKAVRPVQLKKTPDAP